MPSLQLPINTNLYEGDYVLILKYMLTGKTGRFIQYTDYSIDGHRKRKNNSTGARIRTEGGSIIWLPHGSFVLLGIQSPTIYTDHYRLSSIPKVFL